MKVERFKTIAVVLLLYALFLLFASQTTWGWQGSEYERPECRSHPC